MTASSLDPAETCPETGAKFEDFDDLLPTSTVDWTADQLVRPEGVTSAVVCRYESMDAVDDGGTLTLTHAVGLTNGGVLAQDLAALDPNATPAHTCTMELSLPEVLFLVHVGYREESVWLLVRGACGSTVSNGTLKAIVANAAGRVTPTARLELAVATREWPHD